MRGSAGNLYQVSGAVRDAARLGSQADGPVADEVERRPPGVAALAGVDDHLLPVDLTRLEGHGRDVSLVRPELHLLVGARAVGGGGVDVGEPATRDALDAAEPGPQRRVVDLAVADADRRAVGDVRAGVGRRADGERHGGADEEGGDDAADLTEHSESPDSKVHSHGRERFFNYSIVMYLMQVYVPVNTSAFSAVRKTALDSPYCQQHRCRVYS